MESGLAGRERIELDSRKESRSDRMMRSNSFETQKIKEIGRKEARESRDIPISYKEGKECKARKD